MNCIGKIKFLVVFGSPLPPTCRVVLYDYCDGLTRLSCSIESTYIGRNGESFIQATS